MPGDSTLVPAIPAATLQPLWQRAAVLGSLWAASEIVLGSFLHNLRMPFSGHALTAIAIVILVAGHRVWPVPGLLVRAGLIAALMKAISPSAVLLGPMVAIAMEGLLMEAGVRWLGSRPAGYLTGGALAMSWTLGHKVVSLLLTYGWDLLRLYRDLVVVAERKIGTMPLGSWGPLMALVALNIALGAAAAVLGLRTTPASVTHRRSTDAAEALAAWQRRLGGGGAVTRGDAGAGGRGVPRPSLVLLLVWLVALPAGLVTLTRLPLAGKALVAGVAVLAAAIRYRRALRRLGRPGFWLMLLGLTLLAGAVMGLVAPSGQIGWRHGAALGLGMCLHAVFVTMCFAALSSELSHPRLRRWLERRGGGQLHGAVHAAFATLPLVVAALPSGRDFLRRPARTLGELLPRMEIWLQALRAPYRVVGVITGATGDGKTTCAGAVIEALRADGLRIGGVLTPGEIRDGRRWSFDLVDLLSGERLPMATRDPASPWPRSGAFHVSPAARELGRRALSPRAAAASDLLVIDEVGPWELSGAGWSRELAALHGHDVPLLVVARRGLLDDVRAWLAAGGAPAWDVADAPAEVIARAVRDALRGGERARGPSRGAPEPLGPSAPPSG